MSKEKTTEEKILELSDRLFLGYKRDDFLELCFLISDYRMYVAEQRERMENGLAWRKQNERIYINKYKGTTSSLKSDSSCKAKFEDDNLETIKGLRKLRAKVYMMQDFLVAFCERRDAIKSSEIDLKFETKMMQ